MRFAHDFFIAFIDTVCYNSFTIYERYGHGYAAFIFGYFTFLYMLLSDGASRFLTQHLYMENL